MRFEYEKITQVPEHERRCDAFVTAVSRYAESLREKYPSLAIIPVNDTNEFVNPNDLPDCLKRNPALLMAQIQENLRKEINSTICYKATVSVLDWGAEDGNGLGVAVLSTVIDQIRSLSVKYEGKPYYDRNDFQLDDPELPNAWMAFLFVNKDSKPRK